MVKTGEYRQGNKKYFIGETGKVLIGNRKIKGKWYYFDGQGIKKNYQQSIQLNQESLLRILRQAS